MDEMGLIEIAAIEGDFGPCHAATPFHKIERLLKTADPAKDLRREPGFVAEHLNESLGTEPDLSRHARNGRRMRFRHKPAQREPHRTMSIEPPREFRQKHSLQ